MSKEKRAEKSISERQCMCWDLKMTRNEMENCSLIVTVIVNGCPPRLQVLEADTRDLSRSHNQQFGLDLQGSLEPLHDFYPGNNTILFAF